MSLAIGSGSFIRFAEIMTRWDTEKDEWMAEVLRHRPDANPNIVATMSAGEQAQFILDWVRFHTNGSTTKDIPEYVLLAIMDLYGVED